MGSKHKAFVSVQILTTHGHARAWIYQQCDWKDLPDKLFNAMCRLRKKRYLVETPYSSFIVERTDETIADIKYAAINQQ